MKTTRFALRAWITIAGACLLPAVLSAQAVCRPPHDLRVCQDRYGPKGRVFLVWTNGETSYSKVRIFIDSTFAGEGPGGANIGYIDDIDPGPHTFSVEGACGDVSSERATRSFTLVEATPHTHPVEAISCDFDADRGRLTATWVPSSRPSIFIDVYVRRAGTTGLLYVVTIAGDSTSIAISGTLESDRLQLQFFDEDCYGSQLVGCPGPSCPPPVRLRVCQDLYGPQSRVFVAWLPGAGDYTSFEISVDGVKVGDAPGNAGLFYVEPLAPGPHAFAVKGVCGGESSDAATSSFEVLVASPHATPARNVHCERDAAARTETVTWLPGTAPSDFIDVYVRTPGVPLLDFVGTIVGDSTRVRVKDVGPGDEVALQFFSTACYGSPLVSCGENPGSGQFLRGDANGSGVVDLSDGIFVLRYLFLGDFEPLCFDAADSNDDARLDIADPIFTLGWLFGGGPPSPSPGPTVCGPDPTPDSFSPCLTAACP